MKPSSTRVAFISLAAFALLACVGDSPATVDSSAPPQDASKDTSSAGDGAPNDTGVVDAGACSGLTQCGGDGGANKCVDLSTDKENCGSCNHICPSKECVSGDCKKRVFVSSSTRTGGVPSGSALGFDVNCQNLAIAAGLDGNYKAWVSDDTTSPSVRFTKSKAPYLRMDGSPIAADWTNLTSGSIAFAINRTETGGAVGGATYAWSDTAPDGTLIPVNPNGSNCNNWKDPPGNFGSYGDTTATDSKWTDNSYGSCNLNLHFYCFEQ